MLVVVLFVLVTLSALVLSFAYRAGLETRLTARQIVTARLETHANSAVAVAMGRLLEDDNAFDHPAELWGQPLPLDAGNLHPDFMADTRSLGQSSLYEVNYRIIDEAGKLPVTLASSEMLEELGMTTQQIEALFDWMDEDDVQQAEGGEDGYYLKLARPYQTKNAPIQDLRELLLIRGFDRVGLDGEDSNGNGRLDPNENDGNASYPPDNADGRLDLGWVDLLTTRGDGRINLNTAPRGVLEVLPLSDAAPGQIIGFRERGGALEERAFRSMEDVEQLQGLSPVDVEALRTIAGFQSNYFRIIATAHHRPSGLTYRLEVLVHRLEGQLSVLAWDGGG